MKFNKKYKSLMEAFKLPSKDIISTKAKELGIDLTLKKPFSFKVQKFFYEHPNYIPADPSDEWYEDEADISHMLDIISDKLEKVFVDMGFTDTYVEERSQPGEPNVVIVEFPLEIIKKIGWNFLAIRIEEDGDITIGTRIGLDSGPMGNTYATERHEKTWNAGDIITSDDITELINKVLATTKINQEIIDEIELDEIGN